MCPGPLLIEHGSVPSLSPLPSIFHPLINTILKYPAAPCLKFVCFPIAYKIKSAQFSTPTLHWNLLRSFQNLQISESSARRESELNALVWGSELLLLKSAPGDYDVQLWVSRINCQQFTHCLRLQCSSQTHPAFSPRLLFQPRWKDGTFWNTSVYFKPSGFGICSPLCLHGLTCPPHSLPDASHFK